MKKQLTAVALTATMLGGGLFGATLFTPGLAGAQDEAPAAAEVDVERPDASERMTEVIAPLVNDGTLTQSQADAVVDTLVTAGEARRGDRQERREDRQENREESQAVIAAELGISVDELHDAIQDGQTLAEVAEANGVDASDLVELMQDALDDRLAEAVANGDIDQERADEISANAGDRIEDRVNNGGGRRGGPRGQRGVGGPGGAGPDAETEGA